MVLTAPQDSSIHFSRADSEASPATSRLRMGKDSWPALNTARLHRAAMRAKDTHVVELLSKEEPRVIRKKGHWLTVLPAYCIHHRWELPHPDTQLFTQILIFCSRNFQIHRQRVNLNFSLKTFLLQLFNSTWFQISGLLAQTCTYSTYCNGLGSYISCNRTWISTEFNFIN